MVKNPPAKQEPQVWSLGLEDPLEKELATTAIFLPGKSHGQRSLVGYSPWGRKERVGHDSAIEQQQQIRVLVICREHLCIFCLWAGLLCLKLGTRARGQVTRASLCLFLHLRKKGITCHLLFPRGHKLTVERLFEISHERCNLSRSMPIIYFYYPFENWILRANRFSSHQKGSLFFATTYYVLGTLQL